MGKIQAHLCPVPTSGGFPADHDTETLTVAKPVSAA